TIAAILNDEPPLEGLPDELSAVLGRCLSKDKELRYENGGELEADLRSLAPVAGFVSLARTAPEFSATRTTALETADNSNTRTSRHLPCRCLLFQVKGRAGAGLCGGFECKSTPLGQIFASRRRGDSAN